MIVLIDNYDSFSYNLVHALGSLGADVRVFRNDAISVDQVEGMEPEAIVISPGPGTPEKAGISVELIRRLASKIPLLGVCLGHQALAAAYGGIICQAQQIVHGKTSMITHQGTGLYKGLKNPFIAGRYHSLAVSREKLPAELIVEATSDDGEIMGLRHSRYPAYGVQFHPESILTPSGRSLLHNFLKIITNEKEKTV